MAACTDCETVLGIYNEQYFCVFVDQEGALSVCVTRAMSPLDGRHLKSPRHVQALVSPGYTTARSGYMATHAKSRQS